MGRETDDVNFFRYSAHNSNLGEMYLRFSELNSDSRNRRNWSRPTWSFKISSKEKPHLFTRCWLGSLLWRGNKGLKGDQYQAETCGKVSSTTQIYLAVTGQREMSHLSDRFHQTCTNPECRLFYTNISQG